MNPMTEVMRNRTLQARADTERAQQQAIASALSSLAAGGRPRVARAVAQKLLLASPFTLNGKSRDIVGKSVGAGVWELSCKKEEGTA